MSDPYTDYPPAAVRRQKAWMRYTAIGLILLGTTAGVGASHFIQFGTANADLPPSPPPAVTVSTPLQARIANWTNFTGQFSAVDEVEIRAQVSGYLTEIHFTDGEVVHRGDLLFVIDPRPYEIALQQANAAVLTAKAELLFATKETQRIGSLQNSGAVTKEQYDQRVEEEAAASAALAQANASVASAQLNLQFCHVTAPFSGRISTHRVSIGNLVQGGPGATASTLLTTIVSLDPIHLDFQMSEDDYLAYERYLRNARGGAPVDNGVQAGLSDEQGFPRRGTLDFIDNGIDPSTGTIHVRATFPNHDLFITPGAFAQLRLPTSQPQPLLLVPDSALAADQSDEVAMTVAPDGTVVSKIVQTGDMSQGLREITAGLTPNDRVIIEGLMLVRAGAKVTPEQGSITAAAQN
jgi:multidrug efflux system membrane fusion protein